MAKRLTEVEILSDQYKTKMDLQRIPCPIYNGIPLPSFPPLREDCDKRMNDILKFDSKDTDIMICTYPKSGTHWTSEIIMMLVEDKDELLPTSKVDTMMETTSDVNSLHNLTGRRILDSHLPIRMLPTKHVDNKYKIVHIVRNPKDICVSYFHHSKKDIVCGPLCSWDEWIDQFLSGGAPYGSWFTYMKEFEEFQKGHPDFLLVYYEDLHKKSIIKSGKTYSFVNTSIYRAQPAIIAGALNVIGHLYKTITQLQGSTYVTGPSVKCS